MSFPSQSPTGGEEEGVEVEEIGQEFPAPAHHPTAPSDEAMKELWFADNDIPIDVLSRLPTKTLLGFKCVSKEWRRVILDRSFVVVQLKRTEPVSGFFFQERFQWCDDDIKSISYIPVSTGGAEVHRTLLDFLPESVVVVASSNGLLCCRSCFPSQNPVIYICNPSNKEWVSVNWPEPDKRNSLALAFDPFRDPIDVATKFKVVRVRQTLSDTEDPYFSFEIFSSETRTWRRSMEICQCDHNLFKNKGVFIGGVLYWLTDGNQVIMYDLENELSWLLTIPLLPMQLGSFAANCIGEWEGKLHYVMICEDGLQVWVLEDYLESKWALKYLITLDEMEEENSQLLCNLRHRVSGRVTVDSIAWIDPMAFKDGILFMRLSTKIYMYRFDSRKMEEHCTLSTLGQNSMFSPIVLPYSTSLVPLSWP